MNLWLRRGLALWAYGAPIVLLGAGLVGALVALRDRHARWLFATLAAYIGAMSSTCPVNRTRSANPSSADFRRNAPRLERRPRQRPLSSFFIVS